MMMMMNSMMIVLILVASSWAQIYQEQWSATGASPGCSSGQVFDGAACADAIDAGQCALVSAESLLTQGMPQLGDGPVGVSGALALQVHHELTDGRQVSAIVVSAANAACNYPAGAHWSKGVRNGGSGDLTCRDLYNATIPWGVATGGDGGLGCGLVKSEDAEFVNYDGTADVYFTEQLPGQRGALVQREVGSRLYFRLRFRKAVQASTELVQYADPRLLAAVTQQEWNPESLAVDLELQLQLQAPFKVASWTLAEAPPAGMAAELQAAPLTDCADESGTAVCTQIFGAELTATDVCRIDGQYQFDVVLACQEGVAPQDCPIDPADNAPVRVTASLASEDFCALAETTIGARAALSVHRSFDGLNFAFGDPQSAFFQDQLMHYRLQLDALEGFRLASSQIEEVSIEVASNGTDVLIYSQPLGGAQHPAWTYASQFNEATAGQASHEHQFAFVADPAVYGLVTEDSSYQSTVTCVAAIQFAETGQRKRMTFSFPLAAAAATNGKRQLGAGASSPAEILQTTAQVRMQPPAAVESEDDVPEQQPVNEYIPRDADDNAWAAPVAAGLAAGAVSCCLGFVLIVYVRRRKQADQEEDERRAKQESKIRLGV